MAHAIKCALNKRETQSMARLCLLRALVQPEEGGALAFPTPGKDSKADAARVASRSKTMELSCVTAANAMSLVLGPPMMDLASTWAKLSGTPASSLSCFSQAITNVLKNKDQHLTDDPCFQSAFEFGQLFVDSAQGKGIDKMVTFKPSSMPGRPASCACAQWPRWVGGALWTRDR
jgi:hypothetical protein